MDLWSRPLSSGAFQRSVLAFPPRPRGGFSLTPLDSHHRRLLLFGGHSGMRNGHCLADMYLLEISKASRKDPVRPPSAGSDSAPEEIFFAADHRLALAQQPADGPGDAQARLRDRR